MRSALPAIAAGVLVLLPLAAGARPPSGGQYKKQVDAWHARSDGTAPRVDERGLPLLVLVGLNTREATTLEPVAPDGGFGARDLDRAAYALREPGSGREHPVEPRLLDLVYRVEAHFEAPEIRVLSGYRAPVRNAGSNHGKGRAIDFVVPGASDADVATFARGLGYVGVGIYPTSGFVHLDVRDRSYFWSDSSGPGRRNRERGILGDLARQKDLEAEARGEKPLPFAPMQLDVDAALRARAAVANAGPPADDDVSD